MFVATNESGTVVGFASYLGEELRAVYVHPEVARGGVGTSLLVALESHARDHGIAELHLDASLNAEAFYAARGYVASVRMTHPLKRGGSLECVRMTRRLGSSA
jgi:N-acetylglutamate synthase-like GNAT family acetyltransferase